MSCCPPRDPRKRYPVHRHDSCRQVVEQPLTSPINDSVRYTGRQWLTAEPSARKVSDGYRPMMQPDPRLERRRMVSDWEYFPLKDPGRGKERFYDPPHRYEQRSSDGPHSDWDDGFRPPQPSDTSPRNANTIGNGTNHTSYQFDTLPPPRQRTEKPLPRIQPPTADQGQTVHPSMDQRPSREQRHEAAYTQDDPPSAKGVLQPRSSATRIKKDIKAEPLCAVRDLPFAIAVSPHGKHKSKVHQARNDNQQAREGRSASKKGMNLDEIEEEITCPM